MKRTLVEHKFLLDWNFKTALGVLMAAFVILVGRAVFIKLDALQMGFDLGVYEQVIWNTAHGHLFATTAFNYTNVHVGSDLILLELLLAPLYAILPSTQTLLLLQTIAIALGALPLYLLARDRLASHWAGLLIAAAYLIYVPLIYLTLDEFQPRGFALVCVLLAIYYLDHSKFIPFIIFLGLALLTRSDVALVVALLGGIAFLWRKPWKFSLSPIIIGTAWFFLAVFVIVPHFKTTGGGFVYIGTFDWLGKTPGEMLVTILSQPIWVLQNVVQPGKMKFLGEVFGPTLPFSLFRPDTLLLATPTLAINLLSPYSLHWTINHQYGALLYPVGFASSVLGIDSLTKMRKITERIPKSWVVHGAVGLVLGLTLLENLVIGNPALKLWSTRPSPRLATAESLLASVPADAPLAVTNHLGPLAARRSGFYFFPSHDFYTRDPLQVAEYVLIDIQFDSDNPNLPKDLNTLQTSSSWNLLADRDGYLLYVKRPFP